MGVVYIKFLLLKTLLVVPLFLITMKYFLSMLEEVKMSLLAIQVVQVIFLLTGVLSVRLMASQLQMGRPYYPYKLWVPVVPIYQTNFM